VGSIDHIQFQVVVSTQVGVHSMMMLHVSSLRDNTRRHVTCLCEFVSMTTVNVCWCFGFRGQ